MLARRITTRPPALSAAIVPRRVRSASISAVSRSVASGRALRAATVRFTGSPGASAPTVPVTLIVPGPARALQTLDLHGVAVRAQEGGDGAHPNALGEILHLAVGELRRPAEPRRRERAADAGIERQAPMHLAPLRRDERIEHGQVQRPGGAQVEGAGAERRAPGHRKAGRPGRG